MRRSPRPCARCFPAKPEVRNPRRRVEAQLAAVRGAGASGGEFLPALAALAAARSAVARCRTEIPRLPLRQFRGSPEGARRRRDRTRRRRVARQWLVHRPARRHQHRPGLRRAHPHQRRRRGRRERLVNALLAKTRRLVRGPRPARAAGRGARRLGRRGDPAGRRAADAAAGRLALARPGRAEAARPRIRAGRGRRDPRRRAGAARRRQRRAAGRRGRPRDAPGGAGRIADGLRGRLRRLAAHLVPRGIVRRVRRACSRA